ncbi:mandelate racemase [Clostridia bacterium]|nr:mandelate racemase [Clostridia bacterium]
MKITKVESIPLLQNVSHPISDSQYTYVIGGLLITKVYTDDGLTGFGITHFGRNESAMSTVKTVVDGVLAPIMMGRDPHYIRELRNEMFLATNFYGTIGVAIQAIAAVDCAMWDIVGKSAGLPVALLLGARRRAIPAYAMVGWYYEGGNKEFLEHCVAAADEGFRAVKIKVGRYSLKDDVDRIKMVQAELGEDFTLMVDANCIFDEQEALYRGRVYEKLGMRWFEEPIPPYMLESHRRLSEKLDIPLAIGENHHTRHQFYEIIRNGCVSIVQPDGARAGGVTEWMDIGSISDAAGLKLSSHGGGPGNVNVLCAIDNAIYLESGPFKPNKGGGLYINQMSLNKDGAVEFPDVPGMGTDVSDDYIRKYRMD